MFRSRCQSMDLTGTNHFMESSSVTKKQSWRTNLLCGLYGQDVSSSVFYGLKGEEMYQRSEEHTSRMQEHPCKMGEQELHLSRSSAKCGSRKQYPGSDTGGRVIRLTRRLQEGGQAPTSTTASSNSSSSRSMRSFKRRLLYTRQTSVTGSLDELPQSLGDHRLEAQEEEAECEAVATKDCHPSPYDRQALAFTRGDRIEVLRRPHTGIWWGRCRGKEGHFKFVDVRVEKSSYPRSGQSSAVATRISRSQSVSDLLSSMRLESLTSVFVLNGYDTAQDISHLCEDDLEYLGIEEGGARDLLLDTARLLARGQEDSCSSSPSEQSPVTHTSFLHSGSYSRDSGICMAEL